MWPGFARMLESNATTQDKMSYLRTISFCQTMKLQEEEDVKKIETQIKGLINSPLTRYEGLVLWSCALSKSNLYLASWGGILAAGLQCNDSFTVKEQSSIILKKMLQIFGSMNEYRGAFYRFLPRLITILLADSNCNQGFINSCECLAECMNYFPQILASHMVEIESFLMVNLNTDSVQTIEALSNLFSKFPLCLERTIKQKVAFADIFSETYIKAINTLHYLLNDILSFQNVNMQLAEGLRYEVPSQEQGGIPLMYNRIRSFACLSRCLATMMSSETERVRASVEELLVLIRRAFDFDFNQVQVNNQDGELALLFLAYPKICDAAFILLEALVLNFPVEDQASAIMSLILQAVDVSRTSPHGKLVYSQVRASAWRFLNIWMNQTGCRVISEIVSSKLLTQLISEIAVQGIEIDDQAVKWFHYSSCKHALRALSNLFVSGSGFLEEKDLDDISKTILTTVKLVQLSLNPSKKFPFPYCNEECRKELYSLLLTSTVSGNPFQMKCALLSVNLFKRALRDNSIKVKEVCHRGFAFCRYYLHPKKPPPDYILRPTPTRIDQSIEKDNLLDDWGTGWQRQLNGHAPAAENVANLSCSGESSFPDATEPGELVHDEPTGQESPPRYADLGPVSIDNKRTFSQLSSQSYEEDSDSDGGKDSSFDEDDHPPKKKPYAEAAPRARPTVQVLETRGASREHRLDDEDSMDAGTNAEKAMPVPSDGYEEEEDIPMVENRELEESEEGEEEYLEEEEEVEEEEEEAEFEERRSPETEEPPTKKLRVVDEEGESSLHAEKEDVAENDEFQEATSNIDHQEAVGNDCPEPIVTVDSQRPSVNEEHQESIANVEHQEELGGDNLQEIISNDNLQEIVSNDDHHDDGSDYRQENISEGHLGESSNNDCRDENIANPEVNGEYEDSSDDSSSNEPELILPQSSMTVDQMLADFQLIERKR